MANSSSPNKASLVESYQECSTHVEAMTDPLPATSCTYTGLSFLVLSYSSLIRWMQLLSKLLSASLRLGEL